jgi:predicted TIM-barrel fold metal-dependent hydrolase
VLNPTWGLWIPRISDPALRNACAEVYNDWILEYCSENLKRLLPIAMTPITDVDWAVGELQRVVKRGARGVMIGTNPVDADTTPYRDHLLRPLLGCRRRERLPVTSPHRDGESARPIYVSWCERTASRGGNVHRNVSGSGPGAGERIHIRGIFDRFPRLKVFLSEYDASWLPILKYPA